MTSLPMVSLIAYDNTDKPERTLRVMKYCQKYFTFGESILVSRLRPIRGVTNETIYLRPGEGYQAAMTFEFNVGVVVKTDYSLFVSHDGFILNPDKWNDQWLSYDFIGAPWPKTCVGDPRFRVGNTGFCLRSRKFMNLCILIGHGYNNQVPADVFACQTMRPLLEQGHGVKFAPIDVAADFSWELNIEEYPNGRPDAFGFHSNGDEKHPFEDDINL
jgi:hypothetical protein